MNLRRNFVLVAGALSLTACPAFMSDDFEIVEGNDKPDASGGDASGGDSGSGAEGGSNGGSGAGGSGASGGGGEGATSGDGGEGAGGSSGSSGDGGSGNGGSGGGGTSGDGGGGGGPGGAGGVGATGGTAGSGGVAGSGGTSGTGALGGTGGGAGVGGSAGVGGTAGAGGAGTGGSGGSGGSGGGGGGGAGGKGGSAGWGGWGGNGGTSGCDGYLELVLDNSNSMEYGTDDDPNPGKNESRWDFMKAGIEAAMPDLPATLALGILPFPNTTLGSACYVQKKSAELELLTVTHKAECVAALKEATFSQNSVLYDPWVYALDLVAAEDQSANLAIVLTSDDWPQFGLDCSGNGNNVNNQPLIDSIKSAYDNVRIKTYVIGLPGAEDARAEFSRMAQAGGTGPNGCSDSGPQYCHIDLSGLEDEDFQDGVEAAMLDIATKTMICDQPKRRSRVAPRRSKP